MGNLCSFTMKIKGNPENIKTFHNYLTQNGPVWMGRGAESEYDTEQLDEVMKETENNNFELYLGGSVKNSIADALISDAIEMRTTPNRWSLKNESDLSFITLFEACEQLNLDMEVFSEEPGCCFAEHILFKDKKVVTKEMIPFTETWSEEKEDYIRTGGYDIVFEI